MKTGLDALAPLPANYFTGERWIELMDIFGEDDLKRLIERKPVTCKVRLWYGDRGWDRETEFVLEAK